MGAGLLRHLQATVPHRIVMGAVETDNHELFGFGGLFRLSGKRQRGDTGNKKGEAGDTRQDKTPQNSG